MNILNYKLDLTKEFLTACTGFLAPAHLMQSLNLSKVIDQCFPALNGNRTLKALTFINTLGRPLHKYE